MVISQQKITLSIVFLFVSWVVLLLIGVIDYATKFTHLNEFELNAIKYPHYFRSQLNAAMNRVVAKDYAAALMYAQRAIEANPNRASAYLNAHSAAAGLEAYGLAYQYGKQAWELWKGKQLAINMAIICKILKKPIEADYYKKLIPTLPDKLLLKEEL